MIQLKPMLDNRVQRKQIQMKPKSMLIILVSLLLLHTGSALANDPTATNIVQPTANETISTLTTIAGSVDFSAFERYEIFLNNGQSFIWVASGHMPINNGNLARLDPRVFAEGSYQLVIRQVKADSNYTDYVGPTIYIDNPLDAPLAYYPDVEPSFLYASDSKAVMRIKNCSGADIDFDYNSPQAFRDGGQTRLLPRQEGFICTFEDLALIPGTYRGTVRESGQQGIGYEFNAEGGKVYEAVYNGVGAGIHQLIIEPVQGDGNASQTIVATAPQMSSESTTPTDELVGGGAVVEAPADSAEKADKALPQSGGVMESQAPFMVVGLMFAVFMIIGGFITMRGRHFV